MANRAVFLDLNGTLVLPVLAEQLSDLRLIDGVGEAIARLNRAGFVCPVVTVQSGIGKERFTAAEFERWSLEFAKQLSHQGASVLGPYVCPHRYREDCGCKKPNTLLYVRASHEHHIDLARSFVIGDAAADVEAAARFGGRGILVRTGWASGKREVERAAPFAAHIAQSFAPAVEWILTHSIGIES
jgi:histidinol-phosphate phosphatase family protein